MNVMLSQRFECVLEPGEILFVPSNSPHHVLNLDASVAISGNYVDATNVADVVRDLSVLQLTDPLAAPLLQHLQSWQAAKVSVSGEDTASEGSAAATEAEFGVPWLLFKRNCGVATSTTATASTSTSTSTGSSTSTAGPALFTIVNAGVVPPAAPVDDTGKIHRSLF